MGKIIAFVNQKGGVGKTTSSINLAASLGLLGKKTLLIDLDPQGNSSTGVGVNKGELESSIYELLVDRVEVKKVVVKTKFKNLYIIPASINLAGVDMELMEMSRANQEFVPQLQLEKHLNEIIDVFDYIILDCPPSLGLITTNALAASNSVIIPVQCEFFALEGIMQLLNSIMIAQKKLNPSLDIEGVLLTMLDNRTNLGLEVVEEIKSYFKEKVYDTIIPRLVRLSEAPSHGKPIHAYDPRSRGTEAYINLAKEVIKEMETKKRALGKGLEQLFNNENLDLNSFEKTVYETATKEEIIDVNIDELRVNPYQPRKIFNDEALKDLSESIKEHGVFQPIIVKKSIKGYEIIAGERRVRASKLAGLTTIPAIVRNLNDEQMMEIALLENLQRENLSSIEEAIAYKSMIEKLSLTQDELAKKVGKSRSHITNTLGLLRLPAEVQAMVANNQLSMGHARVLSKLENAEKIVEMAHEIVNKKIPVRELEQESEKEVKKVKIERKPVNNDFKYVEELLREKLDTKVKIKDKKIEISFTNIADLNRILEVLNVRE